MSTPTRQQPDPTRSARTHPRRTAPYGKGLLVAVAAAGALGLAACGSSASPGGGSTAAAGAPAITIVEPANNATVTQPFTLKVSSSEPLGATDTGKDHFHLTFDGNAQDYTVETNPQVTIDKLTPGKHIIKVTLQHADHSPVGPAAQVAVTVEGAGGTTPPATSTGGGYGNGY
jgi:hypothetical protein